MNFPIDALQKLYPQPSGACSSASLTTTPLSSWVLVGFSAVFVVAALIWEYRAPSPRGGYLFALIRRKIKRLGNWKLPTLPWKLTGNPGTVRAHNLNSPSRTPGVSTGESAAEGFDVSWQTPAS